MCMKKINEISFLLDETHSNERHRIRIKMIKRISDFIETLTRKSQ